MLFWTMGPTWCDLGASVLRDGLPWWAVCFRTGASSLEAAWGVATLLQKRHSFRLATTVLKMDVYKAFDHTEWPRAIRAMRVFGVSELAIDILTKLWLTSCLQFEHPLDASVVAFLRPTRGLPQGHGASAGIFVMTLVDVLRPTVERWMREERGVPMAAVHPLALIVYYDDILLFCRSMPEAQLMGSDTLAALAEAHFSCQAAKSQWLSSQVLSAGTVLPLGDALVSPQTGTMRILGLWMDACGRLSTTFDDRKAAAWKAFIQMRHVWAHRELHFSLKLQVLQRRIFPCFWGLEALPPSKHLDQRISAVQRIMSAKALGLRLREDEDLPALCRRRFCLARDARQAGGFASWAEII